MGVITRLGTMDVGHLLVQHGIASRSRSCGIETSTPYKISHSTTLFHTSPWSLICDISRTLHGCVFSRDLFWIFPGLMKTAWTISSRKSRRGGAGRCARAKPPQDGKSRLTIVTLDLPRRPCFLVLHGSPFCQLYGLACRTFSNAWKKGGGAAPDSMPAAPPLRSLRQLH